VKQPPHPGLTVRRDCLERLGLTVVDAAKILGVARQTLNNLVNAKGGISPEMAIRLSKAFGSTPDFWLRLQFDFDLAQVRAREHEIDVKPYRRSTLKTKKAAFMNKASERPE
jgi:addiction module HigA family antidote